MTPDEPAAAPVATAPVSSPTAAARPVKRSFAIRGHKTSISLEAAFWDALKSAATTKGTSMAALVAAIDQTRGNAGLSSAVRVWLLDHYRNPNR